MSWCDDCVNTKENCDKCKRNPIYKDLRDFYLVYIPTCPRGYVDCVSDPAYIKFYHPKWYKKLFGDKTPEEASEECRQKVLNDPDEKYYCYDSEDK